MDNSNYDNVIALAETHEHKQKVKLIMNELTPNQNQDVPDPYFGMHNGFDIVYSMLDDACEVIAQKLITKHQ
jgi:protein-tyrosine phosphatase